MEVAIGSMNVPTLSPANRGYEEVTMTMTRRTFSPGAAAAGATV